MMKIEIKDNTPKPVGVKIKNLSEGTLVGINPPESNSEGGIGIVVWQNESLERQGRWLVVRFDGDIWSLSGDDLVYPVKDKTITVTWEL